MSDISDTDSITSVSSFDSIEDIVDSDIDEEVAELDIDILLRKCLWLSSYINNNVSLIPKYNPEYLSN